MPKRSDDQPEARDLEYTRQVPKFLRGLVEEKQRAPQRDDDDDDDGFKAVVVNDPIATWQITAPPADLSSIPSRFVFYINPSTNVKQYTKPACLFNHVDRQLPPLCPFVEFVDAQLVSRFVNLDNLQVVDTEPESFTQYRRALELAALGNLPPQVEEAARERLALLTVDEAGALARLKTAPSKIVAPSKPVTQPSKKKKSIVQAQRSLLSFDDDDDDDDDDE
jgi:hypothetical protein